jgi:hypothetical protein
VVCAGSAQLAANVLAAAPLTVLDEAREQLRAALRAGRVARTARRNTFVLDACCGTATSATLFHLMTNRYARVIGVDRDKAESWVREHIPARYRHRFVFVSADIGSLTPEAIDEVMRVEWGAGLGRLSHFHDSHPCTTLSGADRSGQHRYPDGAPKSPDAIRDDAVLERTVELVESVL